jgi:hypothetical protein
MRLGNRAMSTTSRQETTLTLARIRELLENERVSEARSVLHEALLNQPQDEELQRLRTVLAPPKVRRSSALDVDRTKDFQWLSENGAKHRGYWVAVYDGELVSEAASLDELLGRVSELALARAPLIHHID